MYIVSSIFCLGAQDCTAKKKTYNNIDFLTVGWNKCVQYYNSQSHEAVGEFHEAALVNQ